MVIRSRMAWIALVLSLMPPAARGAQPSLRLTIEPGPLEYGKAIYADMATNILHPDLGTLDLSSLDRDFLVATPTSAVRDGRRRQQRWRILLYPRRSGTLRIPALRFHGARSRPHTLAIGPAVDRSGSAPIKVSTEVSQTEVWLNQPVRVTMQVDSDSRYAWLASAPAQHDGIDIVSLPAARHSEQVDGKEHTRRRIGWLLYPQTTGELSIQLPQVEYHHQGLITHRFYPPRVTMQVRALPAFVPPTMPIGHIGLEVSLARRWLLFRKQLRFLTLRIQSDGPPGQRPSTVLRQLRSSSTITFYPPREQSGTAADQADGTRELRYQVPFTARSLGWVGLPQVRLQYFDPASGKIETRTQSLGGIFVIDPWMAYAGGLLLLWIAYEAGRALYRRGVRRYRAYVAYRGALRMLRQARTPQDIKAALMAMARGEHWPGNLTLAMWYEQWSMRYPRLSFVSELVQRVQAWLYGRSEAPLEEIRHGLVDACYRRMPLLKLETLIGLQGSMVHNR